MPKIIVKYKSEIIEEYIMGKGKVSVGRHKGNIITISDETVSEEHCVISRDDNKLEIEDLNTAFGTTINGKNISKQELNIEDEIGIGSYTLVIRPAEKEEASRAATAMGVSRPEAFLFGIQGKMEGRKFELNPVETRIGRSKDFNDVWISKEIDKSVSRRHATIRFTDGKYILTDRRSRNRTFVNQQQVNETDEIVLKDHDEILIGKSILRFMIGEKGDYAPPKRAGIFFVRMLPKIEKLITILILTAGIFLTYKGISGYLVIKSRPAEVFLDTLNWNPEGFTRTMQGFLKEGTFDIIPSPAIGDINADGINEVVVAGATGSVYAWSGVSGQLLWTAEIGQSMLTSPVLADINNDRILDVVVGADNSIVHVLDGVAGQTLYKSSFIGGRILFASSPLVGDFDGDGFKDIVVVTDDKVICFLYAPIIGSKKPYTFKTPDAIMSSAVVVHDKNGTDKIAVGTNGGKIYLFDVNNPDSREVINVMQKINMLKGVNLVLNDISSIPAVADLDGDGTQELIFATGAYYVVALNIRNQSLMWAYKIGPFSTLPAPLRYGSPAVTDLNMDGVGDVILGWANGKIISLNGVTGEVLWEYDTNFSNRIISSVVLADFNKDGIMDPVVTGEDGSVFILNGRIDAVDRLLSNREFLRVPVTATPSVGDINDDGYIEIVLTAVNNSVAVFMTPVQVFKNELFWQSFRKNSLNSGVQMGDSKLVLYQLLSGTGVCLIFGMLIAVKFKRKRKLKKRPRIRIAEKK